MIDHEIDVAVSKNGVQLEPYDLDRLETEPQGFQKTRLQRALRKKEYLAGWAYTLVGHSGHKSRAEKTNAFPLRPD